MEHQQRQPDQHSSLGMGPQPQAAVCQRHSSTVPGPFTPNLILKSEHSPGLPVNSIRHLPQGLNRDICGPQKAMGAKP